MEKNTAEKSESRKKKLKKNVIIAAIVLLVAILWLYPLIMKSQFQKSTDTDFSTIRADIPEEDLEQLKQNYSKVKEKLDKDGYDFEANLNKADILYRIGDYDKALKVYNKLTELNASDSRPFKALGDIYYNQGKYDEAEKAYLSSIQKDQQALPAYMGLAEVYRYHKNDDRAKINKFYEDGIARLGEKRFGLIDSYASYLEDEKRYDEAIVQLQVISSNFPEDEEVKSRIVQLDAKLNSAPVTDPSAKK